MSRQVYSHYQTANRTRRHFPILMGPNETRRLFTNSPRHQEPLLDTPLRRDMEEQQQQQEQQQLDRQQHLEEGADVQIVRVVFGPNEDQEVKSWKKFAGNVHW